MPILLPYPFSAFDMFDYLVHSYDFIFKNQKEGQLEEIKAEVFLYLCRESIVV